MKKRTPEMKNKLEKLGWAIIFSYMVVMFALINVLQKISYIILKTGIVESILVEIILLLIFISIAGICHRKRRKILGY